MRKKDKAILDFEFDCFGLGHRTEETIHNGKKIKKVCMGEPVIESKDRRRRQQWFACTRFLKVCFVFLLLCLLVVLPIGIAFL